MICGRVTDDLISGGTKTKPFRDARNSVTIIIMIKYFSTPDADGSEGYE